MKAKRDSLTDAEYKENRGAGRMRMAILSVQLYIMFLMHGSLISRAWFHWFQLYNKYRKNKAFTASKVAHILYQKIHTDVLSCTDMTCLQVHMYCMNVYMYKV